MATITEDYVSFETAKLLKERGFDEKVSTHYLVHPSGFPEFFDKKDEFTEPEDVWLKCPTHQMALKWLRGVHNVFIYIEPFITTSGLQGYKPYCTKIGGEFMWINPLRRYSNTSSDTYEEAVEAALKYSLKNLI